MSRINGSKFGASAKLARAAMGHKRFISKLVAVLLAVTIVMPAMAFAGEELPNNGNGGGGRSVK